MIWIAGNASSGDLMAAANPARIVIEFRCLCRMSLLGRLLPDALLGQFDPTLPFDLLDPK
jgi:hypothetical protein